MLPLKISLTNIGVCTTLLFTSFTAIANNIDPIEYTPSQTDFGGVGLMQMPTARMADEGNFNFGASRNSDYEHYYVSMQLLPWLETTARYTQVPDRKFSDNESYSGDTKYTDKGFDVKVRLWEESYWLPDVSIGWRDLAGTGLFDGEYLVTSKRFGPLDFTLGMGWGYLGQRGNITNPLCSYSDEYCTRPTDYSGEGGSVDYDRWFKGNAALFAGIEYQTPYQPLSLKIEYDGNDYSQDYIEIEQKTPINIGAVYDLNDFASLKLSYERGNTVTFGIDLATNFNKIQPMWRDNKKETIVPASQVNQDPDWDQVAQDLRNNAGYAQSRISIDGDTLVLAGEQKKYRNLDEAQDRAATILANNKPANITQYRIIEQDQGLNISETLIDAKKYRATADHDYIGAEFKDSKIATHPAIASSDKQEMELATHYSDFDAGLSPVLKQSVGGPESFYFYNIGVNANASYRLTKQLELSGSIYFNIADNYDKYNYIEDNPHIDNFSVPRVRTMFRAYVHDNPVRMNNLQLTWFAQPSTNIYTQTYGGYLETMFAGVGGEVLYRQMDSNWAIGMDYNYISQRDPDSWFGVYNDDYFYYDGMDESDCTGNGVNCKAYVLDRGTTGQLSIYYRPQWSFVKDTTLVVSAGEFLGGDKGVRVHVSKQFESGMIVGGYVTKTDLTADEYGEGSFNKGVYISIPFDLLTTRPSTSRGSISWQPITRDGGQTLDRKYMLYKVTDRRNPWFSL